MKLCEVGWRGMGGGSRLRSLCIHIADALLIAIKLEINIVYKVTTNKSA